MKEFKMVVEYENDTKEIKSMFDLYVICRHSYENWLMKSIPNTTDIFALKKEFEALKIENLSEEECYKLLDKVDKTKPIKDYSLYELVCVHNACASLLVLLCKDLDRDSDLFNSIEAVETILVQLYNRYIGLPRSHIIITYIWKMGLHLPSGHEYIDVVTEMYKYDYTFGNEEITWYAHELFDDIVKIYGGK